MPFDYDLDAARTASSWASAALDDLQYPAVAWADRKSSVVKRFRQALERHVSERDRSFPEGWYDGVISQLLGGALFSSPTMVARFLRESRSDLSARAQELAEWIRGEPWRYAAFELRETVAEDFHVCVDFDGHEEMLVQSPAVSALSRTGCRVFLSLVFSNGACLQCFGPMHYFRGFQSYDLAAYAEAIEAEHFAQHGLSAVIGRHPELFMLLALYAEIPTQVFRGTPLVLCADWHDAEELPRVAHSDKLRSRTSGHVTQLSLSPSLPDAAYYPQHGYLFFDARKRRVMAHSMGTARYAELVEAAGPEWGFSPLPRWKAGMTMVVAMRKLLGEKDPGSEYIERFEEKADGEDPPEVKQMNALLEALAKRHNSGAPYVLRELAELYGVELETAQRIEQSLKQAVERQGDRPQSTALQGAASGLGGGEPPPPETLRLFNHILADSQLFHLDVSSDMAEELARAAREAIDAGARGGRRGEIRRMVADGRLGLDRLPRFIEEEFLRLFGLPDVTLLTYTVYLLLRFGAEEREVHAYASELLRTFDSAIAARPELGSPEQLGGALARYFGHVLEPLGLVTTPKSGEAPLVRTTPLFRKWIRLSKYWE